MIFIYSQSFIFIVSDVFKYYADVFKARQDPHLILLKTKWILLFTVLSHPLWEKMQPFVSYFFQRYITLVITKRSFHP